ncbi:hypothetical protein MMC11_007964 [Xylographa trunciseda]|nr:hypothetical protein [Xylographa trunciseda]
MAASLNNSMLALTPALAPPPNTVPNFDSAFSGGQLKYAVVTAVHLALATAIVGARFIAKGYNNRTYQREDFATILTWLLFVGYCTITWVAIRDGVGRHQWDISILQAIEVAKISNYGEIFYQVTLCIGKIAILLEYMRIFCPGRQGFVYKAILAIIGIVAVVYTFVAFWLIFQCTPREKIWNPFISGTCVNPLAGLLISGCWSAFSDFSILALPLYSTWRLKMSVRRKLGVSAIFAIGFLGCIASIVRLVYTVQFESADDQNYAVVPLGIWTIVEATIVILVGSLTKMPQFFKVVLGHNKKNTYQYPSANQSRKETRGTANKLSHPFSSVTSNTGGSWLTRNGSSSFVPLKELEAMHGGSYAVAGRAESENTEHDDPENAIRKTVRVENSEWK